MFTFQCYDPAKPRMVTSFKGNQKLIFEGYRYNIHHIVPAKGVKTWRCVCAKKLTSARSWCKGRAETWDNDTQGLSKGEHNHPPEHLEAELEYFKSQLILAAIANPTVGLNELIDEAASHMSTGVNFGSRESLKKSLTVARKAAENGGFKMKCYKNSNGSGAESKMPRNTKGSKLNREELKDRSLNGTMISLVQIANQYENNGSVRTNGRDDSPVSPRFHTSTNQFPFSKLNGPSSSYSKNEPDSLKRQHHEDDEGFVASKYMRTTTTNNDQSMCDSAIGSSLDTTTAEASPESMNNYGNNMTSLLTAAILSQFQQAVFKQEYDSSPELRGQMSSKSHAVENKRNSSRIAPQKSIIQQKKSQRINNLSERIFDRISKKETSSDSVASSPTVVVKPNKSSETEASHENEPNKKSYTTIATQTDSEEVTEKDHDCGCRLIRVCCRDDNCAFRRKASAEPNVLVKVKTEEAPNDL